MGLEGILKFFGWQIRFVHPKKQGKFDRKMPMVYLTNWPDIYGNQIWEVPYPNLPLYNSNGGKYLNHGNSPLHNWTFHNFDSQNDEPEEKGIPKTTPFLKSPSDFPGSFLPLISPGSPKFSSSSFFQVTFFHHPSHKKTRERVT